MGRKILGHCIVMPFLVGLVPAMSLVTFGLFWPGVMLMAAVYYFGPLKRSRHEFIRNPELTTGDHLQLMALIVLSVIAGLSSVGLLLKTPEVM